MRKKRSLPYYSPVRLPFASIAVWMVGFAAVGASLLILTRATTPFRALEAESGTPVGAVTVRSDAAASGGSYVEFGGTAPAGLRISVSGNRFVDGQGNTVRLHGVNRAGTEYMCTGGGGGPFDGPSDQTSVSAIAAWNVNVVRVPLNEGCWLGLNGLPSAGYSAAQYRTAVQNFVSLLVANNMYVIVDLHWTGHGTNRAGEQQPMPNMDHSLDFWTSVANTFKSNPAVIFDLFNEPFPDNNQDTTAAWACLKDGGTCANVPYQAAGMQDMLDAVRATGSTNVVMAGGIQYSGNISRWSTYKPTDPLNQLAASLHNYATFGYCTTQSCWETMLAGVGNAPIVVGELGQGDCQSNYVQNFMNWADTKGISYLGWAWNTYGCDWFPSLISNFDGTPTPFGQGFRDHYRRVFP